jgi:hypothetical protein
MQPYKGCSIPFTYGTENLERPEGVEPSPYGLEDRRAAIEHYGRKNVWAGDLHPSEDAHCGLSHRSCPDKGYQPSPNLTSESCYRTRP